MKRYLKNMNMLTKEENKSLKKYKVCVIGCGGLGGYVIEMLGRLGIGEITTIDGDVFDETNLNRQLLSNVYNIDQKKSKAAKERMNKVNPHINVHDICVSITLENGKELLEGYDVVVDAVDNLDTRFVINQVSSELGIPVVHGSIGGWYGQVTTIYPEDNTLNKLYSNKDSKGIEGYLGNPSFTPALIASIQVSEVLKILLGKGELLRNRVLYVDLLEHDYTIINFNYE